MIDLDAAEKLAALYEENIDYAEDYVVAKTIRALVAGLRAAEAEVRRLQPNAHEKSLLRVTVERDGALAELAAARHLLAAEQTKTAIAREALQFYADPITYEINDMNGYVPDAYMPIFDHDDGGGKRAREALAKLDGREP